ncbi:MAG: hypothetical protein C0613_01665 [Desulfobulbaceae bacterium]|nr:MAG: hypothetical protein C0613_01665 [Desulfobulbaceae bacterium]
MRLLCLAVVIGMLLTGCQSAPKKVVYSAPDEVEQTASPVLADDGSPEGDSSEAEGAAADEAEAVFMANIDAGRFDPAFVESRLQLYRQKVAKWQSLGTKMRAYGLGYEQEEQWRQCTALLEELYNGYAAVAEQQGAAPEVMRKDIAFAESDCRQMFAVQASRIPELLADYRQEAAGQVAAIIDYYAADRQYSQVVAAYENAVRFLGEEPQDLRLKEIYGRALLHTGQLEKAAMVFSQVLTTSGPYEKWPLRLEAAELLIAAGQYEKARAEYLHLADILNYWEEIDKTVTGKLALLFDADRHVRELALYSKVLKAFLSFDGSSMPLALEEGFRELEQAYPGTVHTDAAARLFRQAQETVRQNAGDTLATAEQLARAKEFKRALDLLKELKDGRLPADSMTQVEMAISAINASREHHIQLEKEKKIRDLADQWQEGLNLIDMELYDDAITVFMGLLGTEYDARAAAEIEQASLQAARALRKKAAAIFVRARNTNDPTARKALLNESRDLLETILARYPQVEIAEKVVVNLQVIDEQLMALEGN